MARVSIPGVGEFERLTSMAPWGGEEFVRYLPVKNVIGVKFIDAKRAIRHSLGSASQFHGS